MLRLITIVFLSFNLFACTSNIAKNNARDGTWFTLGQYDASNGFIEKSESSLQRISAEFSEDIPNYQDYLAGYEKELLVYCNPMNAYILGVKGKTYRNVCKRYPNAWQFQRDWQAGKNSLSGSSM